MLLGLRKTKSIITCRLKWQWKGSKMSNGFKFDPHRKPLGHQRGKYTVEVSQSERTAVETLALRNGTHIDGSCNVVMWSLPILEAMTERLASLEKELKEIKDEK